MDLSLAERIAASLNLPVTRIEPLMKGFSTDRKFILYVETAPTYLLRISESVDAALLPAVPGRFLPTRAGDRRHP